MKKLVIALTALAAFTGIGLGCRSRSPSLYQGSGAGRDGSELDWLLHFRRWRRRHLVCQRRRG